MTSNISFQDKSSGKVYVVRVKFIDFNIIGMSIETNLDLKTENKLSLHIFNGSNHASNIKCMVNNVVNHGNKNRYGLQFDFAANEYMCSEEVEEMLANIENNLQRNHKPPYRNAYRRIKTTGR
jgi:hypothetical protein